MADKSAKGSTSDDIAGLLTRFGESGYREFSHEILKPAPAGRQKQKAQVASPEAGDPAAAHAPAPDMALADAGAGIDTANRVAVAVPAEEGTELAALFRRLLEAEPMLDGNNSPLKRFAGER